MLVPNINDSFTVIRLHEWLGAKVIERLAHVLRTAFPEMNGFSPRNLKYMRAFAKVWPDADLCSRLLHNCPSSRPS